MKRRDVIVAVAAAATGGATLAMVSKDRAGMSKNSPAPARSDLAAPALSQNRRQFRLTTSWPKDFPGLGEMPNRFSRALSEMSEGRLDVKVYAAGELVGATDAFDAVSRGAADMYHAAEYYWQGKSKGFSFFTAVPMGMTAPEIMAWVEFGGGQALWDKLSAQYNIKALQAGNTGHQAGGWFKREINSLEDFKGLKIRMPGMAGEVIRRLGGSAVRRAGGEIYQSLQSGAIDATEWVGPWNDLAFGFYREAPYYYMPGFHEPGASLSVGINLDIWNSFSAQDQAMIKFAAKAANDSSLAEYSYQNGRALVTLKEQHGITPRIFSDEIITTIGKISEDVVREIGLSDPQTQEIYESYFTARESMRGWTQMSDGHYIRAREIALRP